MTPRDEFLHERLVTLCGPDGRLQPPKTMGGAAQAEELRLLGRTIARLAPSSGYDAWWVRFEDALMAAARSRTWPMVHEMEAAARSLRDAARAKPAPGAAAGVSDEPAHVYQFVEEWWCAHRRPGPGAMAKAHHASRLVDAGHATLGELWRVGFPIPVHLQSEARRSAEGRQ